MAVFLFSLVIISLAVLGMSIGVLMGRKPLSGTCGGINALGMDGGCEICGGNPQLCDNAAEPSAQADEEKSALAMDILGDHSDKRLSADRDKCE